MAGFDRMTIAKCFAGALDRCDFAEARTYLSLDCRYDIGAEELMGPDAIMASYASSADRASRELEQVIYTSEILQQAGESLSVLYTDRIVHAGQTHEYRCRQLLSFNETGEIVRIVHEELPGQKESLNEFLARCGIRR